MTDDNGGGLSKKQRIALVAVGIVLATGISAAMLTLTSEPWHIGPNATIQNGGGPTIEIAEEVSSTASEPIDSGNNTVDLSPSIVFQSDGETHARLESVGYSGDEWTELTELSVAGSDLTVNPEGSQPLTVGGDAETLRFREVSAQTVDDGRADFVYSGSSGMTTIELGNLPEDTRLEAVDMDTGEVLDIKQSDSTGTAKFDLENSEHRVDIQSNSDGIEISNMSPPDGETVTDSATLSADINYSAFGEGDITVTISGNGNVLHTETLTQNSTVTTTWNDIEGGRNTWTVEAADEFGASTSDSSSLYASALLYVHDGATENLSLMSQDVEAELISTETSSNYREERTISNGAIRLGGVPDEQLLVRLNSSGYDRRELIITEPYGEKQRRTVMFNESNPNAFGQCFALSSSASGFSPESTWLIGQMHIEGEWRDASGGYFGSANQRCVNLEDSEQYRLVVERDGDRRSLGGYSGDISTQDEIIPLLVEGVELSLNRGSTFTWEVQTEANRTDNDELVGGDIVFKFDSGDRTVENLEITIANRSDSDHQLERDFIDGEIGTYVASYEVPEGHLNTTWEVQWTATIDGEEQSGAETVSLAYGSGSLGLGEMWTKIAVAGLLMVMAGIFGLVHAPAGAVVVASTAGLFNLMGLIDLPTLLVSTTLAVAILGFVASKTRGGL